MFMRKWCAAAALGVFLAVPLVARQKDDSAAKPATETPTTVDAPAAPESAVPAARGVFALPAVPKATPFPGPQATKTTKDTRPPGQLVPRFEVNAGYSYINFNPGSGFSNFNSHGATGGFTYKAKSFFRLAAGVGGYHFYRGVHSNKNSCGNTSHLFRPRLEFC